MPDEIPGCCFDEWAASNSKRARKRETAAAITRVLLSALEETGLEGRSVLDVGCGTRSRPSDPRAWCALSIRLRPRRRRHRECPRPRGRARLGRACRVRGRRWVAGRFAELRRRRVEPRRVLLSL